MNRLIKFSLRKSFIYNLFLVFFLSTKLILASEAISVKMWEGLSKKDKNIIQDVAIFIDNKNYKTALKRSQDLKSGNFHLFMALEKIVLWNKYSSLNLDLKNTKFNDIVRFARNNSFFPNMDLLEDNVERVLVANKIKLPLYYKNFSRNKLRSKEAKIYILEEKIKFPKDLKVSNEIKELTSDIWINNDFTSNEELKFLTKHEKSLSQEDFINRIDRLIFDNKTKEVRRILKYISNDYKKLFLAILKIEENPKYINSIILSVPRRLRGYEHLQYRRALFYHKRDKKKKIYDLLLKIPQETKYKSSWWKLRHLYGRELLKEKRYKESYKIISNHGLSSNSFEFSQSSWLSGWISLRFLKNPNLAIKHFKDMYDNVSYPISISRASYWLGSSYEETGQTKTAMDWYKIASQYPTYFYGQVAIHKYRNLDKEISLSNFSLPDEPIIFENDIKIISYNMALRSAYLLILMNDKEDALKILKDIITKLSSVGKIGAIIKLMEEIGDDELTHKVYRYSNRKNVFFISKQYKIIDKIRDYPNPALIHALIKQESGFVSSAKSSAGAIGFMQIMPDTAKQVARKLKIKYIENKLSSDLNYNINIGSSYINNLLKKFNGSKILAIASYNAGPNATKRWIKEFYDPRNYSNSDEYDKNNIDKVIDWVELITYLETRNYVQRVMENLLIYNYLL